MGVQKNIGKNTIGDNKKMEVNLRTYNRSTHNLSTVIRNTQSVGTLVPERMENGETLPQIVSRSKHIILKHWSKPFFG